MMTLRWWLWFWEIARIEVTQSMRGLRRCPGFTAVFILTMSLAFAATVTTASLLEAIVFRPVSVHQPQQLVSISTADSRTAAPGYVYRDTYATYRRGQRTLATAAMYSARYFRIETRGVAVDGFAEGVSPEYFETVGARPAQGRFFSDSDETTPVIVLSERFRRRLFGEGTAVIGESVTVDGRAVSVIGVAAAGFEGLQFDGGADIVMPIDLMHAMSANPKSPVRARNIIGRLAPGVTLGEVQAELASQWPALIQATQPPSLSASEQQALRDQQVAAEALGSGYSTLRLRYGRSIGVVFGLSAILLLIACVNLAGLLLARSLTQGQQIAVKMAVGATRGRAVGRFLTDATLLAFGSFLLSVPISWWLTRAMADVFAFNRTTPLILSLTPGGSTVLLAAAIALAVGFGIGLVPAWRAASAAPMNELRSDRVLADTLGRSGRILLVVQVALSMSLLVGAGLFMNTLANLRSNYAAIRETNVALTRLAPRPGDRRPIGPTYWPALVGQLAAIPGAQAAGLSLHFPTYFHFPGVVPTDRYTSATESHAEIAALTELISPGFFDTFGISRLQGRDFTWTDHATSAPVAIVSQSVADALPVGVGPIGCRLRLASGTGVKELEIVGVVADAPYGKIRDAHQPTVFRPIQQEPARATSPMAHVRYEGDLNIVREAYIRAVDSQGRHYVSALFTFDRFADSVLLNERLTAGLSTFASVFIVALACIGVYSMLAHGVISHTREIGVRAALGATRATIVRMIVWQGLSIAVPGVAVGMAGAVAAARLVRSQLYEIGPYDPWTITAAAVALLITAGLASLVPAVRAARLDPIDALRRH